MREWLEGDVAGATTGRVHFHARVAANVLRDGRAGAAPRAGPGAGRTPTGWPRLGFADDAELAAAIRRGELDDRWDEVRAAVVAACDDKLAVANPGYADELP